jgi:hypothetical protein
MIKLKKIYIFNMHCALLFIRSKKKTHLLMHLKLLVTEAHCSFYTKFIDKKRRVFFYQIVQILTHYFTAIYFTRNLFYLSIRFLLPLVSMLKYMNFVRYSVRNVQLVSYGRILCVYRSSLQMQSVLVICFKYSRERKKERGVAFSFTIYRVYIKFHWFIHWGWVHGVSIL